MKYPLLKSLTITLLLITTTPMWAAGDKTQLSLIVQQQGEPLFKQVDLIIYKLGKLAEKKSVYHSNRHTASLALPAGNYMAQVHYQGQFIQHNFHLASHDKHFITLEIPNDTTVLSAR